MAKVLHNCAQCGTVRLVVTKESGDGAIEGYCCGCSRIVYGAYAPATETPQQAASNPSDSAM